MYFYFCSEVVHDTAIHKVANYYVIIVLLSVLSRAVSRSDQGFFAIVTHQYLLLFQGSLKTKGLIGKGLIFSSHFLMNIYLLNFLHYLWLIIKNTV